MSEEVQCLFKVENVTNKGNFEIDVQLIIGYLSHDWGGGGFKGYLLKRTKC
jgi:hypothetical protein